FRGTARRSHAGLGASVGALPHLTEGVPPDRPAGVAYCSAVPLPPASDVVPTHGGGRRRRAGPGVARRGLPRARVLGRALRAPGADPEGPQSDPGADELPVPPVAGRP